MISVLCYALEIYFRTHSFNSWYNGYNGNSLVFTDDFTLAYICGNSIKFLNTETNQEEYLHTSGDGIGALASNPAYNTIAFSDVCIDAKIYIYELSFLGRPKVVLEGNKLMSCVKFIAYPFLSLISLANEQAPPYEMSLFTIPFHPYAYC